MIINFFADSEIFKRAEIVDANCSSVRRWRIERRAEETTLQNWDTMMFDLGDDSFALRLSYTKGRVEANSLTTFVRYRRQGRWRPMGLLACQPLPLYLL